LTEVTISANSLMLIDISVPRNVHTDVKELAQVQAFNVDDLKAVVAANQESRRQMAREAEALQSRKWKLSSFGGVLWTLYRQLAV